MNDSEVSKQVQQMVQFIKQEAEEKANEIYVAAEEEFNIEKLQLLEAEKRKIRQEYERKEKQVEVAKKINYSKQLNASRLKVLAAQDEIIKSLKESAARELAKISSNKTAYQALLKDLVLQSLMKLQEPEVQVRCKESDLSLVKAAVEAAKTIYKKNTGKDVVVAVDSKKFLDNSFTGGIIMATDDGTILSNNTLDARLDITFKHNLPLVRSSLFKTSIVA